MDFVACFINVSDLLKKFYSNKRVLISIDEYGLYNIIGASDNSSVPIDRAIGILCLYRRDYERQLYNIDNYLEWLSRRYKLKLKTAIVSPMLRYIRFIIIRSGIMGMFSTWTI